MPKTKKTPSQNKPSSKQASAGGAGAGTPAEAGAPAQQTGTTPARKSTKAVADAGATGATAAGGVTGGAGAAGASAGGAVPGVQGAARPAAERTGATTAGGLGTGGTGAASAEAGAAAAAGPGAKPAGLPGPRRVRLSVSRIDPWSVVKFSFLISFAVGIMIVVAAAIFWFILDGMHVFTSINDTIAEIAGDQEKFNILQWVTLERTLSLATIIALIDIVVLTAMSTIFALLYNLTAMLVGGVSVTLTDE